MIFLSFFVTTLASAYISVSPSFIDFGSLDVDRYESRSRTVYVTNHGQETERLNIYDNCFDGFWIRTSSCSTLQRNGSCYIDVEFRPRRVGHYSCSVQINGIRGSNSIRINGSGRTSPFYYEDL